MDVGRWSRKLRGMYRLEDDPDDNPRDDAQPLIVREIAVLVIPAAIMIAGFIIATFVL